MTPQTVKKAPTTTPRATPPVTPRATTAPRRQHKRRPPQHAPEVRAARRCLCCLAELPPLPPVPSYVVEVTEIVARRTLGGETQTTSREVAALLSASHHNGREKVVPETLASQWLRRACRDTLLARVRRSLPRGGYEYAYHVRAPRPDETTPRAALYLANRDLALQLAALFGGPTSK